MLLLNKNEKISKVLFSNYNKYKFIQGDGKLFNVTKLFFNRKIVVNFSSR